MASVTINLESERDDQALQEGRRLCHLHAHEHSL